MAYGRPQLKDPRVLSAGQFNDVTQIDRVNPETFETLASRSVTSQP